MGAEECSTSSCDPNTMEDNGDWHEIVFKHFSPLAASVSLVCDFNGWHPMEMTKDVHGLWSIKLRLLEGFCMSSLLCRQPCSYFSADAYKFFVDGRWELDPNNPHREHDGYNVVCIDLSEFICHALVSLELCYLRIRRCRAGFSIAII